MTLIQARGWENFLQVLRLLDAAGIAAEPRGANLVAIAADADVPDDVATELANLSDFAPASADGNQGEGSAQPAPSEHQPQATAAPSPLPCPPATGPGATRQAWAEYATQLAPPVMVTDAMSRDDIIRAVEAHPDDR